MRIYSIIAVAVAAFGLAFVAPASAQATRTWVSGVGDDVNPCSRTAPCKTFAGAISKTAAGGEISVLDAGGYGALTITKSISIVSDGPEASILGSGVNGVVINTGPTDAVTLSGLFIEGGGTGINGVRIVQGGKIVVRDCLIRGFTQAGVSVEPTAATAVFISDTLLTRNDVGVRVKPSGSGAASALLERVQAVQNTTLGVSAEGASASIRLSQSTIADNGRGIGVNGGQVISFGNNVIHGNGTDGAPSTTVKLQ
jgi:hypothetical protein